MAGVVRIPPKWRRDADVVVVGSGAAGIAVALTAAAQGLRVLVVTKDLVGGATPQAQGGLAAALGAGDTPAAHVSDTLVVGAGLCSPAAVEALAASAPAAIGWLTGLGARLETRDLRLEGGHSARRIVHSGDDATGAEVHRALLAALLTSGVEILDRTVALDLLLRETGDAHGTHQAAAAEGKDGANRAASSGPGVTGQAVADGGMDRAGISAGGRVPDGTAAANAEPGGALARELVPARPVEAARAPAGGSRSADAWAATGLGSEHAGGAGGERSVVGLLAGTIEANGSLIPGAISARAVVIAAGGLGQAFDTTSNPAGATGDGIAIAARAGAVIRDLEFVQFHPTVLWLPDASGQCPLVTEALRGAGAVLRDCGGTPLMAGHDPRGDLAPRDVVAARMAEVIAGASAAGGAAAGAAASAGHVWLDATELGRDLLETGFPTVTAACRKHGIDPVTAPIPVAPGAHYSCGGIRADLDGRTSIPGLYAVGEAASTGVQGANRLASNSVTEAIIAGRRTGSAIARAWGAEDQNRCGPSAPEASAVLASGHPGPEYSGLAGHTTTLNGLAAHMASTFWPWAPQDQHAAGDGKDRGSKRGTAAGTRGKRPFHPASSAPFPGCYGDRGSSTAIFAAHDPQSPPGPDRRELARAMSRYAGVIRDAEGLTELLRIIAGPEAPPGSIATPPGSVTARSGSIATPPGSIAAPPDSITPAPGSVTARSGSVAAPPGSNAALPGSVAATSDSIATPPGSNAQSASIEVGESANEPEKLELAAVEAANLRTVSLLIAAGALRRAESRGCHRRRDATETEATPWHTLARWDGHELVLSEEAL